MNRSRIDLMLKPPEHQVTGHLAVDGALGALIDGAGFFYKPVQDEERGSVEVSFYTSFNINSAVPRSIRHFFPTFAGTQYVPASDGSGRWRHIVLEDITCGFIRPSIIDIKIGSRTWYPSCSRGYFTKCLHKDRETTTLKLGFRISGLQVRGGSNPWNPGKAAVKNFTPDDVRMVLKRFVSCNADSDEDPDCNFSSMVYDGAEGVLSQLRELKDWFENQTIYHFYSSSVLIVYESAKIDAETCWCRVKLVDFAHTVAGEGVIDHNFLGGLCSLIKFISEAVPSNGGGEHKILDESDPSGSGVTNGLNTGNL